MDSPATGHNNPPDQIEEWLTIFADTIEEAQSWLVGEPVTTLNQMQAVDVLIKEMRSCGSDLVKAKKSATAPMYDVWKAEVARWKPTEDDIGRIKIGLVALVDPYKQRLAAENREAERAAYEEAEQKRRAAEKAASKASASDIEAQRGAAILAQEAQDAKEAAAAASQDKVKGMRRVTHYTVTDHRKLLNWIAVNDRDALTAFIDEWARKNHKENQDAAGLSVTTGKEAY